MNTFVKGFDCYLQEDLEDMINNYAQFNNLEILNIAYAIHPSHQRAFAREAMVVFKKGE